MILISSLLLFVILQGGLTLFAGRIDPTWLAVLVAAAMLVAAVVFEMRLAHAGMRHALLLLGFVRPVMRAVTFSAFVSLFLLAFFPFYSWITGAAISLKSNWLWILVGIVALNGIAEETLFRGYVFGNLRRRGLTFKQAGYFSMAVFAFVHLFLFVQNPFIVGCWASWLRWRMRSRWLTCSSAVEIRSGRPYCCTRRRMPSAWSMFPRRSIRLR